MVSSRSAGGTEADFEIESTENFFLLNSTHVKNPNAIDMSEFVGGRKGKLGDVFQTLDHVAFLIKENPNASLARLERYAGESMPEGKKAYDPSKKKKSGECKPHLESRTVRTVKIYSKIWSSEWITPTGRMTADSPLLVTIASSSSSPSSNVASVVNDTAFYDFDTTRVCTNPQCKKTGCRLFEQKTPLINWYFCSKKCYDAFYPQSQR
jgi:hypothetical protein